MQTYIHICLYIYTYQVREFDHMKRGLGFDSEKGVSDTELGTTTGFILYLCHIGWSALFMQRVHLVTPFVVIY
jgi:hypothetical protein